MSTSKAGLSRRSFLKSTSLAAAAAALPASFAEAERQSTGSGSGKPGQRPNIVLFVADEFRADFVGALGKNPTTRTPNFDAMANRGTMFQNAVTNQPLCSPSRACMMTGCYATKAGVWKLGLEMSHTLPTLARVLRKNGYSTNFIGKWHLSEVEKNNRKTLGWVPPGPSRGGFDDLWQGANVLELTSFPYHGTIWDNDGKPITYKDEYRTVFLTDLAVKFLKQPHDKPFLLYFSQLEPHQQNSDNNDFSPPKGYADRFRDPFVPPDLLHLPGNWQSQLPNYYGDVEAIDESMGRILKTLDEQNLTDNTIVAFLSDHGCTFYTHKGEYKRAPQDSAIRIPFQFQGPGFNQALKLPQIASTIDLTPTLLDAVGIKPPAVMQGRSLMPLLTSPEARQSWDNTAFIQISASRIAREIRTSEWCYSACAPNEPEGAGNRIPASPVYEDAYLYNIYGDPAEQLNLVNRPEYKKIKTHLREITEKRIVEAGEAPAKINPSHGTY